MTPTETQDIVARALVQSGNVIPSDRFPRFCEALRLALAAQPEPLHLPTLARAIEAVKKLNHFTDDWGDVCVERDEVLAALEALRDTQEQP